MRRISFRPAKAQASVMGKATTACHNSGLLKCVLPLQGQLPGGKNQIVRVPGKKPFPNARFKAWRESVFRHIQSGPRFQGPIRISVDYWPGDERTRDVSGMLDALFHVLESDHVGLVENDGLIHEIGYWRRHPVDRKNPRCILTLEAL